MANTIEREIRFYRVDTGDNASGKPKIFNPTPVFEHINKLDWKNKGDRYWDDNGKITGCWVHDSGKPSKIVLGGIRRVDLPQIENQGEITPLEIPEKSGLVEQTHIVFFDNNIVGCDVNFFGPRISRLSYYLSEKAFGVAPEIMKFNPILRRDVYKQLKKMKFLKMMTLRIRAPYVETIAKINDNLGEAFKSALQAGQTDDAEIILKTTKRHQGWLASSLLESVKTLSKNPEMQYEIEKFSVNGYNEEDGKIVDLNLLSDKLIVKRAISRAGSRSRALNSKSAFAAIISAYEDLKEEIFNSPDISIDIEN